MIRRVEVPFHHTPGIGGGITRRLYLLLFSIVPLIVLCGCFLSGTERTALRTAETGLEAIVASEPGKVPTNLARGSQAALASVNREHGIRPPERAEVMAALDNSAGWRAEAEQAARSVWAQVPWWQRILGGLAVSGGVAGLALRLAPAGGPMGDLIRWAMSRAVPAVRGLSEAHRASAQAVDEHARVILGIVQSIDAARGTLVEAWGEIRKLDGAREIIEQLSGGESLTLDQLFADRLASEQERLGVRGQIRLSIEKHRGIQGDAEREQDRS